MENLNVSNTKNPEIKLTTETVNKVAQMKVIFRVPSYQRGYRWEGEKEVKRLLEDIYENAKDNKNYCLQPIIVNVVQDKENKYYDLIDGQQRLTTIYLIYKVIQEIGPIVYGITENSTPEEIEDFKQDYPNVKFEIDYQNESRYNVKDFLKNIVSKTKEDSNKYIDYYYMYIAYEKIKEWFNKPLSKREQKLGKFSEAFKNKITIIWYEIDGNSGKSPEKLFTDINAGKIKLTCSELLKAVFYQREEKDEKKDSLKPEEIAFQWDEMERELHDEAFWSFLTNEPGDKYPTRIDLILDLMANINKEDKEKDDLITFFKIQEKLSDEKKYNNDKSKLWKDIVDTFLRLRDWYNDKDLYNKIGYLIATEEKTLLDIYNLFNDERTTDRNKFNEELDELIKQTIEPIKKKEDNNYISIPYIDWNYEIPNQKAKIQNLMLLFNVLSVGKFTNRKIFDSKSEENQEGNKNINKEKFPFDKYKKKTEDKNKREKIFWSLEHINPQKKPEFSVKEDKCEWIKNQIELFEFLKDDDEEDNDLLDQIKNVTKDSDNLKDIFDNLLGKLQSLLHINDTTYDEDKHNIENLALLCTHHNAALSNSYFFSKRQKIIEKDKNGEYIPFCTRMVFYKYYTEKVSRNTEWDKRDKADYLKEIYCVLGNYLSDKGEALKGKIEAYQEEMEN